MTHHLRLRPELLGPVVEALDRAERRAEIRLRGSSMSPAFQHGDTLRLVPAASGGLRFGTVVVWLGASGPRTHRLVGRLRRNGEPWLLTKGDSLWRFDPPFPADRVAAIVAARVRGEAVIALDRGWPRIAGILRGVRSLGGGVIGESGERLRKGVRRLAGWPR
ncbi:MAG: S24/S26 family peptidase [candidate division NC10 bacterium]|nr:S24/S26 family peptidase [candidate division NC10 bacterium]